MIARPTLGRKLLALLLLVLAALADPSPAAAQKPPGGGGGPDEVWCVVKRTVMLAPDLPFLEVVAVRCDQRGEIGAGWDLVDEDLAFPAAMALRTSTALAAPGVWCVARRRVSIVPDRQTLEYTVVRCDHATRIGVEWEVVERLLHFGPAETLRNSLNAADAPPIWCFIRRPISIGTQRAMQFSVARCDQLGLIGGGWEVVERDITFAAASAARDAANLAEGPAVWCVIRRFVPGPTGTVVPQFSTVRCDQFGEQVGGLAWEMIEGPLSFTAAIGARDVQQAIAAAAGPAPDCNLTLPGSVATRGPTGGIVCTCPAPLTASSGRCVDLTGPNVRGPNVGDRLRQDGAPDEGCSERFPRRHPQSVPGWNPCLTQEAYDQVRAAMGQGQPRR